MDNGNARAADASQVVCPFLQSGSLSRRRGIPGYCTGRPDDELMVPSPLQYQTLCSTRNYTACPIYRYRRAPEALEREPDQAWFPIESLGRREGDGGTFDEAHDASRSENCV